MYQQDDRGYSPSVRRETRRAPRHAAALRLPGGVITTVTQRRSDRQIARRITRFMAVSVLTNRQTLVSRYSEEERPAGAHQMLHSVGLDALATANDMNRNVLCASNPYESQLHAEAYEWAKKISEHLLPRSRLCGDLAHVRRRWRPRR